jgi:2-oxoacid:acceptor oxidoreductase gamma subunit (pyruvate/2-ketoisovalerate family)
MEREVLFTGIGGQGVQLASQVLARAALLEGREVMLLGVYGGAMRGGSTDATLVVGDRPIDAPPLVPRAWAAVCMHHQHFAPLRPKLRKGGVVIVNASLFEAELDRAAQRVFEVPATSLAAELGAPLSASLVLAGAFAALTALVGVEALVEGMRESLPSYRRQHAPRNEQALRAGFAAVPRGAAPAWTAEEAA